jgi:predicted DNA binding CopG/RHH family protein
MKDLDPKEKELLESYDRDEWQSVSDVKFESERYRRYAGATFKKDKRVNIRMSEKDLVAIQKRALEEGIPYQTLIASILHKYISGRLSEKNA